MLKRVKYLFLFWQIISMTFAFAGQGFDVSHSNVKNGELELNFELGKYSIQTVKEEGKKYSKIIFSGNVFLEKKGYAKLPFISSTVQLDPKDNLKIDLDESKFRDIRLDHPLLPSKGELYRNQNPAEIPYEVALESIKNKWYPLDIINSSKPFILRDVRGMNVFVRPFQYNAQKKILRVYSSVKVLLRKDLGKSINPIEFKNQTLSVMDNIYKSIFINYKNHAKNLNLGEVGDILVIYTERDREAIKTYVDWKREKGFNVIEKVVAKGTNVKDLIKTSYEANKNILYVQLVGDWEDIMSDKGPSRAPTDPMLGCVIGDDHYADLIIGRFSAKNPEELLVQINKTVNYEKNPDMSGTWYKRAIGIGSSEGAGNGDDGESDTQHIKSIRDNRLLPNSYEEVHEDYAITGVSSSRVGDQIDRGVGLINYAGHGSESKWVTSGFSNRSIGQLGNGNMLPFIISVACINGEFHKGGDSFAEVWLKKENGGAVAVWMSTINQPWTPPMRGQDYFNDMLIGGYDYSSNPGNGTVITDQRTTFGSLTFNAAHLMYAESNSTSDLNTIKTWTIFGDASLQVRTDKPYKLAISNLKVLAGLSFETEISSASGPVQGAMVALSDGTRVFSAVTDALGKVNIQHDFLPGTVTLTVTAFNSETISREMQVIPFDGPYIVMNSMSVEDYNNSEVDYGEEVGFSILLQNVGNQISSDLKVKLISESGYVEEIVDNEKSIEALGTGEITTIDSLFIVKFSSKIKNKTWVPFKLIVEDIGSKKTYESDFSVKVNAPDLEISYELIGGEIQPGTTGLFKYTVTNTGKVSANNFRAKLTGVSEMEFLIIEPEKELIEIPAGGSISEQFEVKFGETDHGDQVNMTLSVLNDDLLISLLEHKVFIGMTDTFESGNFSNVNWSFSGNQDWVIDAENFYSGKFSAKSGKIKKRQKTAIEVVVDFKNKGTVNFFRKVSSEARYDKLYFYIDGAVVGSWSGELDWKKVTYEVAPGTHNLKWEYKKDYSKDDGSDCAWIDDLLITNGKVL